MLLTSIHNNANKITVKLESTLSAAIEKLNQEINAALAPETVTPSKRKPDGDKEQEEEQEEDI